MASSSCWKCLNRPSMPLRLFNICNLPLTRPNLASSFSTSTTTRSATLSKQTAKALLKKNKERTKRQPKLGSNKTLRLKKKAFVKTGRPPAPGERKALRKRIVVSNSNAIEVESMVDLTAEIDAAQVGAVVGLPGPVVDQLRAVEAFKTTQAWSLFRRPAMLIRAQTVEVAKMIERAQETKSTRATIFDGERNAGKSMMLLQAMAVAFTKDWIVLNIPEARDLTNALTAYSPIAGTTPTLYSQTTYTATLLGQIAKANNKVLSNLQLAHQHKLPTPLPPSSTLARLAEVGARDPDISWTVFNALWKELTSAGRPPILLALDGLQYIMTTSAYRSPEYSLIHAHDLALVRHFVSYLSGAATLPNGGAVVAATSKSNIPLSYAVDLAIAQKRDVQAGKSDVAKRDPWTKIDERAYESLQVAELMVLKGISKVEARALMEYWAASGLLRQRVDEGVVAEKWTLSGNGIVGEMERGALRMNI